ncbi:S16 family serine protease [Rummeliibacillus sp. NPDC094406]|uniref:S16 family serine protease n=1 Tax=Rummeliibacillus sp. NPDC094406 TaxID=3364511 RepID=UPI0037F68A88
MNFKFMENKLAVTEHLDKQNINALNIIEGTNQLRYESKNRQLLEWFHLKKDDVEQMKESVRYNLKIEDKKIDTFLNRNHIDGNSAGLALVLSGIIIKGNLQNTLPIAITGGIDKKGDILSIGALKEKIQIASLSGIPFMIVPSENAKEAAKIQKEINTNIQIFNVATINEAIKVVNKINNKNK